jgi:nucleotide-binding universal stress UspA family protein
MGEPMFRHILVPIDLSDRNARTLRTALDLALQNRARVTLLHVVHHVANIPADEMRAFYRRLVRTSEGRLERAAKLFAAKGVDVRAEVCIGEPASQIVRIAGARKVDLTVMGSHKVGASRRSRGWGTTSYKVGILCPCPILLVK